MSFVNHHKITLTILHWLKKCFLRKSSWTRNSLKYQKFEYVFKEKLLFVMLLEYKLNPLKTEGQDTF